MSIDRPRWLVRSWRVVRKDIGRKLTALGCALLFWGVLENLVVGDRPDIKLDVRKVATLEEADQSRVNAGIYLVVPNDLIVLGTEPSEVKLHVKGLKDDVANLNLSAVMSFDATMLAGLDEGTIPVTLDRDTFKSRGDPPRLTYFKVHPDSLQVRLARRATADITLSSQNVTTTGKPRQGFSFDNARTTVRPSNVTVSGPRKEIEKLRKDPTLPGLTPVDIADRSATVTQVVGLPQSLIDAGVTLQTPGSVVDVSIFLEPEEMTKVVVSVPVDYRNAEALTLNKWTIKKKTETLDLKVIGPAAELDAIKTDDLRRRISLVYDWADATLPLARPKVRIFRDGLFNMRIVSENDEEPQIEYALETMPGPK